MKTYQVNGFYETNNPCTIIVIEENSGYSWYAIQGFRTVSYTSQPIVSGIKIEDIKDIDLFIAKSPIISINDLMNAINE